MKHTHWCPTGKHWYTRPGCASVREEHDCKLPSQIDCEEHRKEKA